MLRLTDHLQPAFSVEDRAFSLEKPGTKPGVHLYPKRTAVVDLESFTVVFEDSWRVRNQNLSEFAVGKTAFLRIRYKPDTDMDSTVRQARKRIAENELLSMYFDIQGLQMRVAASSDVLLEDKTFVLATDEGRARIEGYFGKAHAALIYGSILISEYRKALRVKAHEILRANTWGDLRARGFHVPQHHESTSELPDSQIWVAKPGVSQQVRFVGDTVAGKGVTYHQPGLGWTERMHELGVRMIIPDSCVKSQDRERQDLVFAIKQANNTGSMRTPYIMTAAYQRDGAAERIRESNMEYYEDRVAPALTAINPHIPEANRVRQAQRLMLLDNMVDTEDEDSDIDLYTAASALVTGGWDPLYAGVHDAVLDRAGRIIQNWTYGMGLEWACRMITCDARLKPGECNVRGLRTGPVAATRPPYQDPWNVQIVDNVDLGIREFAVHQDTMTPLQGDFDGDRVGFSDNPVLLEETRALHAKTPARLDVREPNEYMEVGEKLDNPYEDLPGIARKLLYQVGGAGVGSATNACARAWALGKYEEASKLAALIQVRVMERKRVAVFRDGVEQELQNLAKELREDGPGFLDPELAVKPKRFFIDGVQQVPERCWLDEQVNIMAKLFQRSKPHHRSDKRWDPLRNLMANERVGARKQDAINFMFQNVVQPLEATKDMEYEDAENYRRQVFNEARTTLHAMPREERVPLVIAGIAFSFPFPDEPRAAKPVKGTLWTSLDPETAAAVGAGVWERSIDTQRDARDLGITFKNFRVQRRRCQSFQVVSDPHLIESLWGQQRCRVGVLVNEEGRSLLRALDVRNGEDMGKLSPRNGGFGDAEVIAWNYWDTEINEARTILTVNSWFADEDEDEEDAG